MTLADQRKLYFGIGLIAFIILAVGGYGYFKMRNLLEGPVIAVSTPQNGTTVGTSTEIIRGTAKNVSSLSLNDRPIFIDEQGNFSETVALSPGYNILSLKGQDKFGKKTELVLQLTVNKN